MGIEQAANLAGGAASAGSAAGGATSAGDIAGAMSNGAGGLVSSPGGVEGPGAPGLPGSAGSAASGTGSSGAEDPSGASKSISDAADVADADDFADATDASGGSDSRDGGGLIASGDEGSDGSDGPAGKTDDADASALGQGGTSSVGRGSSGPEGDSAGVRGTGRSSDGGNLGKDAVKAGGVGLAAGSAGQAFTLMALLNYLKMLLATAQAFVSNIFSMIFAAVMNGLSTVVGFFTMIGGAVSSALGISAIAAAIGSGVGAALVVFALVGSLLAGAAAASAAQSDTIVTQCTTGSVQTAAASNADPTGVTETQTTNAQTIYSVLAAWGMSDANIAGILGNWQAESGIDPTRVQNSTNTPYTLSDAEQTAAEDTSNGIGLGQWTGGRNTALREFASSIGEDWWTVSTQLSYMMSSGEGANVEIVKNMIAEDQGDPSTAALYFHREWERSADTDAQAQRRADYAETWFGLMSGWTVDKSLADSVLAQAGTTLTAANQNQVASAKASCRSLNTTNVMLRDGGMTQEDAQKLVDLYNQEGDAFLDGRYGQYGGPGSCGDNHAENCVSFSTYFLNKYTTYQQYPWGNGIDTARTVSKDTGKSLTSTPVAYSVGSGPGSGSAGHTLVVLGVEGDNVIVGEAGYCLFMGRVTVKSAAALKAAGWVFVDVSDMMLPTNEVKTS